MWEWHRLLDKVLIAGSKREDRTGIGTMSLFGISAEFSNAEAFPAVTTKALAFGQVKAELACFLRGYTTLEQFHSLGCTIWDGNGTDPKWLKKAEEEGTLGLGRIYGAQWRGWASVVMPHIGWAPYMTARTTDQLADLIKGLRENPTSRRHVVTAFNPGEIDQVCLPPCHLMFQCYVSEGYLDMSVYMRSCDLFLGLPFDVASFALLQRLLAREVGLQSRRLVFQFGDAHIYLNHMAQVIEVLKRTPFSAPHLSLFGPKTVLEWEPENALLMDYEHYPAVKAPLNI